VIRSRSLRRLLPLALTLTLAALLGLAVGRAGAEGALLEGPSGPTADDTPTFSWAAAGAATCALDGAAAEPCTSPWTTPELAEGAHLIEITVGDASEVRSLLVDTTVPVLSMADGEEVLTEPTTEVAFTAEAGAATSCAIDAGDAEPCTSPWTTPALANGTHTLRILATDDAGNTAERVRVVRLEVTPPETTIIAGPTADTPEPRPAFAFAASRLGSRFACTLDGAATPCGAAWQPEADLAVGSHTLSVRAIDAAGNGDPTPAERTFRVVACERSVRIGAVDIAADCIASDGERLTATGPVRINGITLNPRGKSGAATTTIDKAARTVSVADVQLRVGSIVLYHGDLRFTIPEAERFTLATIDLETRTRTDAPAGDSEAALDLEGDDDAQAGGFPLKGQATLELDKGAAVLTATIELPQVFTDAEGNGLTGTIKLSTDNTRGVRIDQARVTAPLAFIGKLELQNLSVAFIGDGSGAASPTCNAPSPGLRWEGSASVIVLPTVSRTELTDVGVGFADGTLSHAEATWKPGGSGAELGGGVRLQQLTVSLCTGPPLKLMGRAGLTAMPDAAGKPRLEIPDAGLIYTGGTDGGPWTIRAEAPEAKLGGAIPFAFRDLFVQVNSLGAVSFGGGVKFSVPLKGTAGPITLDAAVAVDAQASGFIEGSRFNVELKASGCFAGTLTVSSTPSVPFSDICPGIDGLVSSTGFAVCGSLKVGGTDVGRIGAGKRWDGDLKFMTSSCDVGSWRVAPTAPAATASRNGAPAPRGFRVAGSRRAVLVAIRGAHQAPRVTLRGPGGATITTPADASEATRTPFALAFTNTAARTTYVALKAPRAGEWTAVPVGEADVIAEVTAAPMLAPVRLRASVERGVGRGRQLRYAAELRRGQRVRFVEQGEGVARTIGAARSRRGTLAFQPAPGPGGRRTITAYVEQDGVPREQRVVARYTAPAPQRPGRPARVIATRDGARGLAIRWSRGARSARTAITVVTTDGRRLFFTTRSTRLRIPGLAPGLVRQIRVVGLRADNVAGPASITTRIRRAGA
jgi:hypothetical protein